MVSERFYRVTSGGKGYYSRMKEILPTVMWIKFLANPRVSWLPNVNNIYESHKDCIAFFTQKGYHNFLNMTVGLYPIPFQVTTYDRNILDLDTAIYKDDFQVIWGEKRND